MLPSYFPLVLVTTMFESTGNMTAFIFIAPVGAINSLLFRGRERSLGEVQTAAAALPSHRESPGNFPALFPFLAPDMTQARSRHTPAVVTALAAPYPPDVPHSGQSGKKERVAASCDRRCWIRSSRRNSTAEELPVPRRGRFRQPCVSRVAFRYGTAPKARPRPPLRAAETRRAAPAAAPAGGEPQGEGRSRN